MFPLPTSPLFGNFPNIGADSRQRSGTVTSGNAKYHCITCRDGYNDKSLEEIRWQDYGSGKRGSQQQSLLLNPSHALLKPNYLESKNNNVPFVQSLPTFGQHILGPSLSTFGTSAVGHGATLRTNTPITSNNLFSATSFSIPTQQPLATSAQQNNTRPNALSKFGSKPFSNLFAKPKQEVYNKTPSAFQFSSQPPQQPANPIQSTGMDGTGSSILHHANISKIAPEQSAQQASVHFINSLKAAQPKLQQTQQCNPGTNFNSALSLDTSSNTKHTSDTNLPKNNLLPCAGYNSPSPPYQPLPTVTLQTSTEEQFQQCQPLLLTDPFGYHQHFKGLTPVKHTMMPSIMHVEKMQKYLQIPERISVSIKTRKIKNKQIADKKSCQNDDESSIRNFVLVKRNEKGKIKIIPNEEEKNRQNYIIDATDKKPLQVEFVSSGESHSPQASTQSDSYADIQSDPTSVDNSSVKIDTCGIILTRPEYYTIPPLDELADYKQSNGECLVQGFTVGRVGYGSVSFPDVMNVADLNLDEIVHFRYREVVVYSDESNKPALGHGLNRHAQITLDNIYPRGRADGKMITDVAMLACANFAQKLIDICEKQGTRFVDYRPETGSWVFMVKHFSIYKYYE